MGNLYDIDCHDNNTFQWSARYAPLFIRHQFDDIIKVFFQPVTCIIGSLLNMSFLFVIFRLKDMQTITNAYLVNLAISDLLFLISNTVIETMQYVISPISTDYAFLGTTGCVLKYLFYYVSFHSSMLLVPIVALERYAAICFPLTHRRIAGKRRTAVIITACWIVALIWSVPTVLNRSIISRYCVAWPPNDETYSGFPEVIGQCVPLPNTNWNYRIMVDYVCEGGVFVCCFLGKYLQE